MQNTRNDKLWTLEVYALLAVTGVAAKSTFIAFLDLGPYGIFAGIFVAIWMGILFWATSRWAPRLQGAVVCLTTAILTVVLYADLLHIRAFGRILDIWTVETAPTLSGLGPSIVGLMRLEDVFFLADTVILIAFYGVLGKRQTLSAPAPRRPLRNISVVTIALYLGASLWQASEVHMSPRFQLMTSGPIGVHANQALSKWSWSNYSLNETERAGVDSWLTENAVFTKGAPEMDHLHGVLEGYDVYLIVVESLEKVVIGLEVEGQEVAPNMNAMLEEGIVFNQIIEQTRDGNTADAELMILTGQYPTISGAAFLKHGRNHFPVTLPDMLRKQGYSTSAIHGDVASFWNREVVFANVGFDDYISEEDFIETPAIGMGVADAALFQQSLIEVERMTGPRFLMITTLTSHFPYDMPSRLKGLELMAEECTTDYLQTIHYVDDQIAEFVEALKARKDRPSAFVIVGDHEGIHRYSPETWLTENDGQLPFFVHIPGMDGSKIDNPGGQIDILPTLAYLMGIPEEAYTGRVMGRNLLGSHSGSSLNSDGDPIGSPARADLLTIAYDISDLAFRGDYFAPE